MRQHREKVILDPVQSFGLTTGITLALEQLAHRGLGTHSVKAEGHVVSDHRRYLQLEFRKVVRLIVVDHELTEQPSVVPDGDERKRPDTFRQDDVPQAAERRVGGYVWHQNWLGVLNLWGPRGVAVNGPTIAVGQTPPRLEAHHPSVIKHQDAGPAGLGGGDHRTTAGPKRAGRLPTMSHQIGNAVQGVKRHWPLVSRKYSRPSTTTSLTASQRTSRTRAGQ